jgi:ABC-type tungstate transport system permease subunit
MRNDFVIVGPGDRRITGMASATDAFKIAESEATFISRE